MIPLFVGFAHFQVATTFVNLPYEYTSYRDTPFTRRTAGVDQLGATREGRGRVGSKRKYYRCCDGGRKPVPSNGRGTPASCPGSFYRRPPGGRLAKKV